VPAYFFGSLRVDEDFLMRESVELTGQKDSLYFMGGIMFSRLVLALLFCVAYAAIATANVSEQA